MLHICGKSNFNIPDVECDGSLHFEGVADTTINQGVGIDLAEGVSAYDSDGNEVEFTYKPEEIEKCDVGEHTVTYTAQGKNAGDMIPTVCGTDRLHLIDCGLDTVKATRIITITQAGDPVIQGIDPTLLPSGSTVDLLSGVTATDDNGNELEVTWYGEKDSLAEGDIATFETDLAPNLLKKAEVRLDPIQDLHGYDRPWVGGAGTNKWDEEWELGYWANGVKVTSTAHIRSKSKIPINPDTSYYWSITSPISYTFYDVNGNFLSISGYDSQGRLNKATSGTITTPSNAYFITFNMGSAYGTTYNHDIALNYPSTATSYAPYENICPIYGHDDVEVWHTGVNVWDEEWELGQFNNITGDPISANDCIRSKNFIEVKPNTTYYTTYGDGYMQVFFYTEDETFISYSWIGVSHLINTPINCSKMKFRNGFAYGTTYNHDISINYPATDTEYHSYQGTTYNQEIEVTYTPTSTNNIPYNFKAVGDIYGDRLRESIVGGTVTWNQQTANANKSRTVTPTGQYQYSYGSTSGEKIIKDHIVLIVADITYTGEKTVVYNYFQLTGGNYGRKTFGTLTPNVKAHCEAILKPSNTGTGLVLGASTGDPANLMTSADAWSWDNLIFRDLTNMFGTTIADYVNTLETANVGDGIAWLKKYNPKLFEYDTYNTGEIKSVEGLSAHQMIGFNQWDEEWELGGLVNATGLPYNATDRIRSKNFCKCLPNTIYYVKSPNQYNNVFWYDSEHSFISRVGQNNGTIESPDNARYFKICNTGLITYNNDICINLSSDKNGTYEPYEKHSYPLDSSLTLRGILTLSDGNIHYDGDEYTSNGPVNRQYGIVDLGTLNWTYYPSETAFYCSVSGLNRSGGYVICDGYTRNWTSVSNINNLEFTGASGADEVLWFKNTAYTDAASFKAAVSGKYLVYKLKTPTTEQAMPFADPQIVSKYGTEAYEGSEIPVGHNTTYLTRDIYGGTLDLVSGVLTVTHKMVTLDNATGWTVNVTSGHYRAYTYALSDIASWSDHVHETPNLVCDRLTIGSWNSAFNGNPTLGQTGTAIGFGTDLFGITTTQELETWIAENPLQIVYKLATPQTYQLNRHQIETLVGENNMWDDGYMKVVYTETIQNNPVTFDVDGTYAITYEAEDECGNETRQTRLIFIRNENVYFLGLDHVTNTLGESFDLTENVHAYDGDGNELEYTVTPEYNAFALGDRTYTYTANGYSEGRVITIVPPTTPIQTEDDEDIETDDGIVLETDALTPIPLTYASNKWTATIPINPLHTYTFRLEGLKAYAFIRVNVTGVGGDVASYDGIGTSDWNLTWTPSEHVISSQTWENARQALIEISQTDEPTAYVIVQ